MREVVAVKDRKAVFLNIVLTFVMGWLLLILLDRGSFYVISRLAGITGLSFMTLLGNSVSGITLPYVLIEHDAGGIYIHRRLGREEYISFDDISSIYTFADGEAGGFGKMPRMMNKANKADYCGKLRILLRSGMTGVRFVKNVKGTKEHLKMILSAYYKAKYDEDI